ncbi:MAG TPA: hypothetical protein VG097_01110 [Gemmata sp.]|jgi:hypothetical protein|nr:hypothetical protein [Gemmata sp.]
MNETKWLTGLDGEAMLDFVADRLSPRQWVLLSAATVRKLWDLFPEGILRQAVDNAERVAHPLSLSERTDWLGKIDDAIPKAVGTAESLQREIVRLCDPDAADLDRPVLSRPNQSAPAFPLFQAASRHARNAIELIGNALTEAAQCVRTLYSEPSVDMLDEVRNHVEQASETRTNANLAANRALRMKTRGDEVADEAAGAKNKRLMESIAIEEVRKIEEGPRQRTGLSEFDEEDKRERAARKQLALLLREVIGNPFSPPRCEPAWRTSTVLQLAQGIFDERAFDRMPILADALLDADCDEEAMLRHCRGTELWNKDKEPVYHIRGCWVIELILGRFEPLSEAKLDKPARPRRKKSFDDFDIGLPFDMGEDRLA